MTDGAEVVISSGEYIDVTVSEEFRKELIGIVDKVTGAASEIEKTGDLMAMREFDDDGELVTVGLMFRCQ